MSETEPPRKRQSPWVLHRRFNNLLGVSGDETPDDRLSFGEVIEHQAKRALEHPIQGKLIATIIFRPDEGTVTIERLDDSDLKEDEPQELT